jgi:hypothetical protein
LVLGIFIELNTELKAKVLELLGGEPGGGKISFGNFSKMKLLAIVVMAVMVMVGGGGAILLRTVNRPDGMA